MKYEDANVADAPERDDSQQGEDANMAAVPERDDIQQGEDADGRMQGKVTTSDGENRRLGESRESRSLRTTRDGPAPSHERDHNGAETCRQATMAATRTVRCPTPRQVCSPTIVVQASKRARPQ